MPVAGPIQKFIFHMFLAAGMAIPVTAFAGTWQLGGCGRGVTCPDPPTPTSTMTASPTPDLSTPTPSITGTPPTATLTPTASPSSTVTKTATFTNSPTSAPTAVPGSYQQLVVVGQREAQTDSFSQSWSADRAYTVGGWGYVAGGTRYISENDAMGTSDPELFKGFRQASTLEYRFDLPNGSYRVSLNFCDFLSTGSGQRVLNVSAQSSSEISSLDLYSSAGASQAATRSFNVTVSGGSLDLLVTASSGLALLNSIAVQGLQPILSPTMTPSFTASPTPNVTPFTLLLDQPSGAMLLR
jgi:hypothetical protein